jgi:hypothetical protein
LSWRAEKIEVFEEFITRIADSFNAAGLDYMFTGALAASYYGVPRTTTDADVVVKVSQKGLHVRLIDALRKTGIPAKEEQIDASLKSGYRIITFKDGKTPLTLDIILSTKKLQKKAGTIVGTPTFYQTPEELIIMKLRMIKATMSENKASKDRSDVKAILKFTEVNMKTIQKQSQKDNTAAILESMVSNAENREE